MSKEINILKYITHKCEISLSFCCSKTALRWIHKCTTNTRRVTQQNNIKIPEVCSVHNTQTAFTLLGNSHSIWILMENRTDYSGRYINKNVCCCTTRHRVYDYLIMMIFWPDRLGALNATITRWWLFDQRVVFTVSSVNELREKERDR